MLLLIEGVISLGKYIFVFGLKESTAFNKTNFEVSGIKERPKGNEFLFLLSLIVVSSKLEQIIFKLVSFDN